MTSRLDAPESVPSHGAMVDRFGLYGGRSQNSKIPCDKFVNLTVTMEIFEAFKDVFIFNGERGKGYTPNRTDKLQIYYVKKKRKTKRKIAACMRIPTMAV